LGSESTVEQASEELPPHEVVVDSVFKDINVSGAENSFN